LTDYPLDRLREVCLEFPEAVEAGGVGNPSFKVGDKIFAMQHDRGGRPSLWFKAPEGVQELVVGSEPARFFRPPYVGHHGWVGAWLDVELDWEELADFVEESYRMTAPKRLTAQLDA
jgi:predicted DNA-binding protein (MmcQ/YjbR family)